MPDPARDDRQPDGSLFHGCYAFLFMLPVYSVAGIVLVVLR